MAAESRPPARRGHGGARTSLRRAQRRAVVSTLENVLDGLRRAVRLRGQQRMARRALSLQPRSPCAMSTVLCTPCSYLCSYLWQGGNSAGYSSLEVSYPRLCARAVNRATSVALGQGARVNTDRFLNDGSDRMNQL